MGYDIAFATDQGQKKANQDSLICMEARTSIGEVVFAAVCDGMGGLEKGELASAELVRALERWFCEELPVIVRNGLSEESLYGSWHTITTEVNKKLITYGERNHIESGIGTTLSGILLAGNMFYVVHVGDSRIYAITENEVTCLTKDHTLAMDKVDEGTLSIENMEKDPRRSILTRCVGAVDDCNPDFFSGIAYPETVFLTCSDGFRHLLSYQEIQAQMCPGKQRTQEELERNIKVLIRENLQRGERDNITVVAVRI